MISSSVIGRREVHGAGTHRLGCISLFVRSLKHDAFFFVALSSCLGEGGRVSTKRTRSMVAQRVHVLTANCTGEQQLSE